MARQSRTSGGLSAAKAHLSGTAPEDAESRDKVNALLASEEITEGRIVVPIIDSMIDVVRGLKKPWDKLNEFQQGELISTISSRLRAQLMEAVKIIAAGDAPRLSATLADFKVKGSLITGKIETVKTDASLISMGHSLAGQIEVIFVNGATLDDGSLAMPKADPDQADLIPDEDQLALITPDTDADLAGNEPVEQQE